MTIRILILLLAAAYSSTATAKPNFIIIFADDQGYGDLSCFGSETIKTPNIDRLAAEGRKFTSFMVASPVCTPSRAALLTGCYPKRVGMHQHVLFPSSKKGTESRRAHDRRSPESTRVRHRLLRQMASRSSPGSSPDLERVRHVLRNSLLE